MWLFRPDQQWRLHYPSLWLGGCFDRTDKASIFEYAILRMPAAERDVFVLNAIEAWDYLQIGRHLDLTTAEVEARLAAALLRLSRVVDFIESLEPNRETRTR
ncbi:RNA polymerase subunit sigma-24 [Caulobacter flavus]|uniref:RNA polymerase subunit sigma-24 n=1 Tax=Caulobacter flavus TaxID=1679497 RepID=A0A2N5CZL5_9CAUL|nr:sigma factor-like helix-turn-helix DNA-binding protein [Caulobacter flavus]AYV45087.1 RNA polymerase subunit sigma-24 [Caulobacter flavus]PLR19232.1 RNA polymerase subunit sigma-24 [Caulobacter flavus]